MFVVDNICHQTHMPLCPIQFVYFFTMRHFHNIIWWNNKNAFTNNTSTPPHGYLLNPAIHTTYCFDYFLGPNGGSVPDIQFKSQAQKENVCTPETFLPLILR